LNGISIFLVNQEAVVPMLIKPTLAPSFQIGEINNPAHQVLGVAGNKKIGDVIVPMEVLALAPMLKKAVACTEANAAHYCQCHAK
jgi:hypothetical protein